MQEATPPTLISLVMDAVTRRQVLLGGVGTVLLAACSKGGGDDASATTSTTAEAGGGGLILFNAFQPAQPMGKELRLPLGLADKDGSFDVNLPKTITVRLQKPDGTRTTPVTLDRHEQDLPRGYFPLVTTFDATGRWSILADVGKAKIGSTVDVRAPSEVPVIPGPGDALPNIPTPTTANHLGVKPICTHDPVCPFHSVSLDQAIGGKQPIALLVSTPAFCQVAICGPVLDLFIKRRAQLEAAGVAVIHAEVYVNDRAQETTATVNALGLDYEPALFLAAPDGTVTTRLDSIFDGTELDEALARLVP